MIRWTGGRMRRGPAIALITATVVVAGGVVSAVTLTHSSQGHKAAGSSQVVSVTSPFRAAANVTPPVAASMCKTPTAFTYSGTISAIAPGTVRYQWVYSSGKPGPVRAVRFTTAGHKEVAAATVRPLQGGGGWAEIKIISPIARTSKKAAYKLLCGGAGGITVTAAVQPSARTVNCATAPPAFTATGSISAVRAETVTYFWAQSDGTKSAPATLTFTKPGTQPVKPLTISPPAASGTGDVVLVITSPVTAASRPATFTLTCTASIAQPAAAAGNPPPTTGAGSGGISPPSMPTLFVINVNASTAATVGQSYSGTVTGSGGVPPYIWSAVQGLPPGITASISGATITLSGTLALASEGRWHVYGQATDSYFTPQPAGWQLDLTVSYPAITISCNLPPATVGEPYAGTITATGGDGTPFTWANIPTPGGLTSSTNGGTLTISGTPDVSDANLATSPPSPGHFDISAIVSDSQTSIRRDCTLVVDP